MSDSKLRGVSVYADSILKEHRLTGDSLRFKQILKRIELPVIREAEFQFASPKRS
ncbi:hypothetical protein JXJ21_17140 [candidate division KSB1 bacterium]|nr:hypothetical protein [candidate division KSB1 bacterium]